MKAVVNIGLRKVEIRYLINPKNIVKLSHDEMIRTFGKDWEIYQKNKKSDLVCKQVIWFKDFDEWQRVKLFDGRLIDFHYYFENSKEFDSKVNWGNYIFQGHEYVEGENQMYDKNIVEKVKIIY